MTLALGSVPAGTTLYIPFATYAGATGASATMTGLAVTDIEVYKNGSTTQRASDAGFALLDTDGIDFDGITGIHGFSLDLSDNTDSGFYAVGSWYWVVVSAVTVDSQTVNFVAAVFRIGPAESVAGYPKADVSHFGGSAGTFSGGRPEVNASHAAGTAWNSGAIGANTLAADTLTAAKVAADVTTELQAGLATAADLATANAVLAKLDDTLEDDSGTFRFTANALEESPTGGSAPTASAIADEVQTRTIAAVTVVNGLAANVITAAATAADFTTEIQSGLATAAAVADLPTNAELATALAAADDAVLSAIDAVPTATENADALLNRDMSAVSDTNSRSPLNALRFLRNKWSIAGTDLTVTKENDSTAAWTATVTAAPGADPISGSDPA
jgi:hypothetical protein